MILSTIHEAVEVISKTKYNGEALVKLVVIHDYNFAMNVVNKVTICCLCMLL